MRKNQSENIISDKKFTDYAFYLKIKVYTFLLCISFFSCAKKNNQTICTLEFRTINLTVNGVMLNDYYTIRESTGDTIRNISGNVPDQNLYPILDDNAQHLFPNNTEKFRFIGVVSDSVAVNEIYSIKADQCHIEYVSGKLEVTL